MLRSLPTCFRRVSNPLRSLLFTTLCVAAMKRQASADPAARSAAKQVTRPQARARAPASAVANADESLRTVLASMCDEARCAFDSNCVISEDLEFK